MEQSSNRGPSQLRAVIEGLRAPKRPWAFLVRTDSKYVRDGTTKWIHDWKSRNWIGEFFNQFTMLLAVGSRRPSEQRGKKKEERNQTFDLVRIYEVKASPQ